MRGPCLVRAGQGRRDLRSRCPRRRARVVRFVRLCRLRARHALRLLENPAPRRGATPGAHGALSNENTRQAFASPGRVSSAAIPLVNSATMSLQNVTAARFPSETRTVHFPGRHFHRRKAARRPTPRRRYFRITKNSATSNTSGSAVAGDPRVARTKPATRPPCLTRYANRCFGSDQ